MSAVENSVIQDIFLGKTEKIGLCWLKLEIQLFLLAFRLYYGNWAFSDLMLSNKSAS